MQIKTEVLTTLWQLPKKKYSNCPKQKEGSPILELPSPKKFSKKSYALV